MHNDCIFYCMSYVWPDLVFKVTTNIESLHIWTFWRWPNLSSLGSKDSYHAWPYINWRTTWHKWTRTVWPLSRSQQQQTFSVILKLIQLECQCNCHHQIRHLDTCSHVLLTVQKSGQSGLISVFLYTAKYRVCSKDYNRPSYQQSVKAHRPLVRMCSGYILANLKIATGYSNSRWLIVWLFKSHSCFQKSWNS